MAKSSKSKNNSSDKSSAIEDTADDAVIVPTEEEKVEAASETTDDAAPSSDTHDDLKPVEETDPETEAAGPGASDDRETTSPHTEETDVAAMPAVPTEPTSSSGAGAFGVVLGGVIAGAIGYVVGSYYPLTGGPDQSAVTQSIEEQGARLDDLEARVDNIPAPDFSEVERTIAEIQGMTGEQISGIEQSLAAQIEAFDTRISELEMQPNADGTLSETALEAYRAELDELRQELNTQQESVLSAAAQAEADLAAARQEAETLERQAIEAAEAAAARAALNRISTAVETGAPFADALSDLDESEVPQVMAAAAADGVATRAELASEFPAVARAALATARSEGVSEDAAGIGGFLRSQFDVRSTAPRDGSDPDAVLSRAEAAVRNGQISDALAEIETLPEVARAEMTDWVAAAEERADVLDAIATLSETYN